MKIVLLILSKRQTIFTDGIVLLCFITREPQAEMQRRQLYRLVITVVGKDKPGILAYIKTKCAEREINIVDNPKGTDLFTMIMIVVPSTWKISVKSMI